MIQNSLPEEFLGNFTNEQVKLLKHELIEDPKTTGLIAKIDDAAIEREQRKEEILRLHNQQLNNTEEEDAYLNLQGLIQRNSNNLVGRVLISIKNELEYIYELNNPNLNSKTIDLVNLYSISDNSILQIMELIQNRFAEI